MALSGAVRGVSTILIRRDNVGMSPCATSRKWCRLRQAPVMISLQRAELESNHAQRLCIVVLAAKR